MSSPLTPGRFDLFNIYANIFEGFAQRMAELLVACNSGNPTAEPEMEVLWESAHRTWEEISGMPPIATDADWGRIAQEAKWDGQGMLTGRADAIIRWFSKLPYPGGVPK